MSASSKRGRASNLLPRGIAWRQGFIDDAQLEAVAEPLKKSGYGLYLLEQLREAGVKVSATAIPDVKLIEPKVFGDERGFFMETWTAAAFADAGLDLAFVQDNHSRSQTGVLRGLHYQVKHTQGKLVRVTAGSVFDVAVDMRRSSPTFGQWVGYELSAANKRMLWVPPGFAHGFLTLEDGTDFLYKCTDIYAPEWDRTLIWNDPTVGIDWPMDGIQPLLSAKDIAGRNLADAETFA